MDEQKDGFGSIFRLQYAAILKQNVQGFRASMLDAWGEGPILYRVRTAVLEVRKLKTTMRLLWCDSEIQGFTTSWSVLIFETQATEAQSLHGSL